MTGDVLFHVKKTTVKNICWCISFVCYGNLDILVFCFYNIHSTVVTNTQSYYDILMAIHF